MVQLGECLNVGLVAHRAAVTIDLPKTSYPHSVRDVTDPNHIQIMTPGLRGGTTGGTVQDFTIANDRVVRLSTLPAAYDEFRISSDPHQTTIERSDTSGKITSVTLDSSHPTTTLNYKNPGGDNDTIAITHLP